MKHLILLLLFFLLGSLLFSNAQEKKNLTFGGNISLDLGRFNDLIEVNPTVSFKSLPKIYIGFGLNYYYNKQETISEEKELNSQEKSNYYGASTFIRYYAFEKNKSVIKNLYLHSEFEYLNGRIKYSDSNGNYNYKNSSNNVLSGIGFKFLLGNKFAINSNLLFKLNNPKGSPYRNPVFRLGFEF
jgi:hypothetical protein